jgi:hypothetical protein
VPRRDKRGAKMTEREILNRIIGPDATLADVEAAFTGDRAPEYRNYTWHASAKLRGHVISIEGAIFDQFAEIGHFIRRLYYEKGCARAKHEILEIARDHHRCGIALAMYRAILPFYDAVGIRFIHLDAAGMGPFVWPDFGFELERRKQKEQLLALLRAAGIEPLPLIESLYAAEVVDIEVDGEPNFGGRIMAQLGHAAEDRGQSLPMFLDLSNQAQRAILEKKIAR